MTVPLVFFPPMYVKAFSMPSALSSCALFLYDTLHPIQKSKIWQNAKYIVQKIVFMYIPPIQTSRNNHYEDILSFYLLFVKKIFGKTEFFWCISCNSAIFGAWRKPVQKRPVFLFSEKPGNGSLLSYSSYIFMLVIISYFFLFYHPF